MAESTTVAGGLDGLPRFDGGLESLPEGWDFVPLKEPQRLSEQVWPPGTRPWVSIFCVTYQHCPFIARAIEGFLMQETTFPVELLIHDDASTDGTADIVRAYAEKYPHLIRAILQTENQYSKGRKAFRLLIKEARGRFIAMCEGDDYWNHPRKLERQNAAMARHPGAAFCSHNVEVRQGDRLLATYGIAGVNGPDLAYIDQREVLLGNAPQLLSIFFRNAPLHFGPRLNTIVCGDRYLFSQLSTMGGLVHIPEVMGIYNIHSGGVYSSTNEMKRLENMVTCYQVLLKDIPAEWAPEMGVVLARLCRDAVRCAVSERKPRKFFYYLSIYPASFIGPLRGLRLKSLSRSLWGFFEIVTLPFLYVLGFIPRQVKKRFAKSR